MHSSPLFGRLLLVLYVVNQHRILAAIEYLMAKGALSVAEVLEFLDKDEPDWNDLDVGYNDGDYFPLNLEDEGSCKTTSDPLDQAQGVFGEDEQLLNPDSSFSSGCPGPNSQESPTVHASMPCPSSSEPVCHSSPTSISVCTSQMPPPLPLPPLLPPPPPPPSPLPSPPCRSVCTVCPSPMPTVSLSVGCNFATFAEQVGPVTSPPDSATAINYFQLFFTDSAFDYVVQQTNQYATQNSPSAYYKWTDIIRDELKGFFRLCYFDAAKTIAIT